MKKINLICLLSFFLSAFSYSQNYTISGHITDLKNGETVINASIFDSNLKKGCVSNSYGFYSLTLPKGAVNLLYSYVGYRQQAKAFKLRKDTVINIQLSESYELSEVTVVASRKDLGVKGSQMSAIDLPIAQIKSIPTLFGETDVLKAIQLLPGVKAGTEGQAGFYVRGGGPDENLILLDDVPLYNVNHMFGFFSVFNADAIKDVVLYKGSFPARFGGRLSSIVDISMNDSNNKTYHGNVTVGLISSKVNLEGPIFNDKTTFNISARRTYLDIIAQPLIQSTLSKQPGMEKTYAGYYFYDLNAKISHKFSDNDRLYLSFFSGNDVIYSNIQQSSTTSSTGTEKTWLKMNWNWGNFLTALRWNHVISGKLFMNATAYYTRYNFLMDIGVDNETVVTTPPSTTNSNMKLGFHSGIDDYAAKLDFSYAPNPAHDIKFGLNYTYHTFRPGVTAAQTITGIMQAMDTTIGDKDIYSHEAVAYFEDNVSITDALKANIGLHYSTFNVQGQFYQSLEPRLSMRYLINDKLSLKAGYASMSQYIHLLSNSNIDLPTDLWVPVTKRIQPMHSQQVSVGVFYNLLNLLDLSVEGYYKNMDNLIEYKDGSSFFGSSTGWEDKVNVGRGWAYGIEFLAQKTVGKTTGWIGYTWSKTDRLFDRPGQQLNNGLVFPAKYDRTHDFSLVISHKFSDRFDLAATWVYSTGNSATLALQNYQGPNIPGTSGASSGIYNVLSQPSLPYISARNNYRYQPTHRLDVGANFHKKLKHGTRTWNVSVYNAYNQLNPFLTTIKTNSVYDANTGVTSQVKQLVQISLFPIIPSVSYSYKF